MRRFASIISTIIFLAFPRLARAQVGELADQVSGFAFSSVFETILLVLKAVIAFMSFVLGQLMNFMSFVMEWQVASNNEVVQVAWAMGRDISNIFFIVGLIIISFATMFRTFGVLQSFHWKTALPRLLMAAILINLSLALSQTVVLFSNHITNIMGGIIKDSGFQLTQVLKVASLKNNFHVVLATDRPITSDPDILSADDQALLTAQQTEGFDEFMTECQNEESEVNATFWQRLADKAPRLALAPLLGPVGFVVAAAVPLTSFDANIDTGGVRKSYAECVEVFTAANRSIGNRVAAFASFILTSVGNTSASEYLYFIITSILNIFMLAMVIISLGSAVLFYMLRVMAIWILLFLSSFAFGFAWIPGAQSLKKWWNVFLGWNVFGPVYLFFLIIGMSFLVRQSDLIATLNVSPNVGPVGGLFQILFFYIFAAIVFTGGLMLALNSSFAAAVKSTPIIGGFAEKVGVFSATKWSQAFGRRVLQATRAPAYFQATRERLAQTYRERQPLRRLGVPTHLATQEEMAAAARARLGVHGGAQETYDLRSKRIKESSKRFDAGLKGIVSGKDGKTDPKSVHEAKMEFLRSRMNSRNKDEALAARQQLMKFGAMSADELKDTQKNYLPGGIAQAEFAKQLRTGEGLDPYLAYSANMEKEPDKAGEHAERFFGKILRNPSQFGKLSYSYINPGSEHYGESLTAMQTAANRIWPPGASGSKEDRARYLAKQKLIGKSDDPLAVALANKIFKGTAVPS